MLAIRRILVGTDFSDCSTVALDYGRELAKRFGASLHIIHIVETVAAADLGISGYAAAAPQLQAEFDEEARRQLAGLITEEDRATLDVKTVLERFDTPSHAIVDYAKQQHIDMIVIGTHGRRGLTHLMMGSVAERIVRMAPCPVLTVRYTEESGATRGKSTRTSAPAPSPPTSSSPP